MVILPQSLYFFPGCNSIIISEIVFLIFFFTSEEFPSASRLGSKPAPRRR